MGFIGKPISGIVRLNLAKILNENGTV